LPLALAASDDLSDESDLIISFIRDDESSKNRLTMGNMPSDLTKSHIVIYRSSKVTMMQMRSGFPFVAKAPQRLILS
jgi:hypothetical protein